MGWTSTAEDISQRQAESLDGRGFGPIPAANDVRTPGGHRRVGRRPPPAPAGRRSVRIKGEGFVMLYAERLP